MKEELLCPFHYFGISDIVIDGESIDEKTSIKNLTSDERVKHILEKSKYYSYSGERLYCLIFVSKVEEAKILVEKFLEQGVKAIALILSALGIADMWMAVFADTGVTILAVLNSFRALKIENN